MVIQKSENFFNENNAKTSKRTHAFRGFAS